jgi:hypothetical protein
VKRLSIALLLLTAAGGRLSAQVSVIAPAFGTLRAGETARIEWRGLPQGVEELELLLVVEGRESPVRVTPQLVAPAGVFLWRVPNLPSPRARLLIRYGLDGEEIEDARSAPFEILPAGNEPPAALAFRYGEWWTEESTEDRFPGALQSRAEGDRIGENREASPCAGASQFPPGPARTAARRARLESLPEAGAGDRPVVPRRPTEVPARI